MTKLHIEIAYGTADEQVLLSHEVDQGCSVAMAIEQSGILQQYPEINLNQHKVGIFGQQVDLEHLVEEHDRIEIYRPLVIDPKTARMLRVQRKKS